MIVTTNQLEVPFRQLPGRVGNGFCLAVRAVRDCARRLDDAAAASSRRPVITPSDGDGSLADTVVEAVNWYMHAPAEAPELVRMHEGSGEKSAGH
jgi:hypothetical protein